MNDAPRSGRPAVVKVDKFLENIEIDRHVSSRSIAQKLKHRGEGNNYCVTRKDREGTESDEGGEGRKIREA